MNLTGKGGHKVAGGGGLSDAVNSYSELTVIYTVMLLVIAARGNTSCSYY